MQKMMRTMDPQKNIKIMFDDCQKFIGMRIEKTRTSAICIGTEDYIRTDGIVYALEEVARILDASQLKNQASFKEVKKQTVKTDPFDFTKGDEINI